jgi:hypothetical protein
MVNGGRGGWISVGYLGNGGALDLANGSYGYGLNAIRGMDGFKLFENLSLMGHINWGSILIGDFDGNQQKEIITYSDNVLHFYSGLDGHEISSFIVGSYTPFIENYPPAVGDINGDGKAEIICAAYGTNKLYAFVLANSDIDSWDWPMVSHDPERTGNFNNYLVTRYAISGSIKDSSGVGVGGVQLKDANNNLLAETNANGEYGFLMPSGWSGTVTPSKTNYNFTPPNKSYNNLNSNQTNQDYVANLNTYTVSGLVKRSNMGVSGVAIKEGNATLATTDQNGYYSFTKSFGWTGTVYPEKPSYSFSPQSRSYVNLSENKQNQNYEASLNTYAVSGFIKDLSGIGVAGVKIIEDAIKTTSSNTNQYEDEDNLEKINLAANQQSSILAVTDSNGYYSFTKPSGWTGTVHPEKTGYTFTPQSRSYINLTSNQTNQDYVATLKTFSIQGSIFLNNAGLAGVQLIEKSTLTVLTTTNQFGTYSFTKPFGWSGTVVPYKDGYVFDPVARNYNNINSNQLNQNYHTSVALAISGYVRNNTNIGIGGVVMQVTSPVYSPPMEVKTDSKGFYQIWVPMGWSGRVTPTSFTYVFSPPYSDYVNLTTNASQDYIGT